MRCKNDKNIKFVITRFVFKAKNAPKSVFGRLGELTSLYDAPTDPLVGWGGGYPLPIPLDAFGVSNSAQTRFGSQATLNTKSMAIRQCVSVQTQLIYSDTWRRASYCMPNIK